MFMKEEGNNVEVVGIIDNDVYDSGNVIQNYNKSLKEFDLCISIPVRKMIYFLQKCTMFHIVKYVDHGCFG